MRSREQFTAYVREHSAIRVEQPAPTMGAEDFAYFAGRLPGLLIRLGVRSEAAGAVHPAHSPIFRIDERALPLGIESLVLFAALRIEFITIHTRMCMDS